ncbi:WAS/WASL-interacting protein family member 3-like [Helianthus annuus]|uniref:WAS/WASL-interacting protein family member 3-like n=1 Tax=Helianthus annuus TaxID=4232 RepID=UPI000B90951F|nr:WAS/WASL-interacting protein family member 3-like [Helianthus annuus]
MPDPVSAHINLPPIAPLSSQPPPVAFITPILGSSLPPFVTDAHRSDLPTIYPHEIPAPRPREGTSGQPPSFDPLASAGFMPTSHFSPFEADPYCQSPRWFPPYSMPLSDPYHPSHHAGYTRDDLFLSLQLQFEILSRRVLELECEVDARQPPPPLYPPPVTPPPPSFPPPVFPSSAPVSIEGFNARFLTAEQQISFLVRRVHELKDELAYLRSLIFPAPPPPLAL